MFTLNDEPRVILVARHDIEKDTELLYDYGDRWVWFGWVGLGLVRFCSFWFGLVLFGLVRFGWVWFGSYCYIRFGFQVGPYLRF